MFRKARDLTVGDVFALHIYGEVLSVTPIAGGRRIKVKLQLEDQGQRDNCGMFTRRGVNKAQLEFTDRGHVVEFLCPPSRNFHLIEWWDDDDDDRSDPINSGPQPSPTEAAS